MRTVWPATGSDRPIGRVAGVSRAGPSRAGASRAGAALYDARPTPRPQDGARDPHGHDHDRHAADEASASTDRAAEDASDRFRRTLWRAVALPAACLGALVLLFLALVALLLWASRSVEHSDVVVGTIGDVPKLLVDMETGVRGYQLRGDRTYLQPYLAGRADKALMEKVRAELTTMLNAERDLRASRDERVWAVVVAGFVGSLVVSSSHDLEDAGGLPLGIEAVDPSEVPKLRAVDRAARLQLPMPRTVELVVPAARCDLLLPRVRAVEGVVAVMRSRGGSVEPAGDVLRVVVRNDALCRLIDALRDPDGGGGGDPPAPLSTSKVDALFFPPQQGDINEEGSETGWEETAALLRDETALSTNYLALMALSGGVAAVGLWTDDVLYVIASQVIAPGFEPILRVPLGLIARSRGLAKVGLASTASGYAAMAVGAAAGLGVLALVEGPKAWADNGLVQQAATVTAHGTVVAAMAGAAGALALLTQKTVFFTGVLIALSLVPTMAVAGMAAGVGRWDLAGGALLHWSVDATAVLATGFAVLGLKQVVRHRRRSIV